MEFKPYILCSPAEDGPRMPAAVARVRSPLRCLRLAGEAGVRAVFVSFHGATLGERETLLDLCRHLKPGADGSGLLVVALLPEPHRDLLEWLREMRVDRVCFATVHAFAKLAARAKVDAFPWEALGGGPPRDVLHSVCPYLGHQATPGGHELPLCGAYANRMVIGGDRLRDYCCCPHHVRCEFYRQPHPPGDVV